MNGNLLKISLCLIITLFASFGVKGQIDTTGARKIVVTEAYKFVQAQINNDQETFLAYMHPQALKQAGGAESLRKVFKQVGVEGWKEAKFKLKGPGQIIFESQAAQCALYYDLTIKLGDTLVTVHHNLIAISAPQNAKKWYFIDAMFLSLKSMKSLYSFIGRDIEYLDTDAVLQLKREIKWKIPPFIKAKSIEDYDPNYGQVAFRAYLGKSTYTLDGIADIRGKELVPPSYLSISGGKHKWSYAISSDESLVAFKKSPAKTFPRPYKGYSVLMDTILFPSGLTMINVAKDSFKLMRQGKVLGYVSSTSLIYENGDKYISLHKDWTGYLMNQAGKVLISPGKFSSIQQFENGFSAFATLKETDKYVLIDTLGNILTPMEGLTPGAASTTFFTVSKKDDYNSEGIIDQRGKMIVSPQFENIELISDHFFAGQKNEQWTIYNMQGQAVLNEKFDWIKTEGSYWVSSSKQQQKMFLFDKNLKLIQSYKSDGMHYFVDLCIDEETKEPFVAFATGFADMVAYDKNGKRLTDEKSNCQGGFIPGGTLYTLGDKMGLATFGNKKDLPPIFSELNYLKSTNTLWGKMNGKWGLLDW